MFYWILSDLQRFLAKFFLFQFLSCHSILNNLADFFFKVMKIFKLFNWLELHGILTELFNLSIRVRDFHVTKLGSINSFALFGRFLEKVKEMGVNLGGH